MAGALPVLDSFIRYHRALRFARIYLFFDDPSDPAIGAARAMGDERITLFVRGPALETEWRRCVQFDHYAVHAAGEVMARQSLNVEVAVQHALAEGIEWLLHIDSDELFDCRER